MDLLELYAGFHVNREFGGIVGRDAPQARQIQDAIGASQWIAKTHLSAAAHRDDGTLFGRDDFGDVLNGLRAENLAG